MVVNKSFLRQFFTVMIVSFGTIIAGSMNGWGALAFVKLTSGNDIFTISEAEYSTLVLCAEIGHFAAPIPGGLLADYFGRKPMFAISSFCALIGWAFLTFGGDNISYIIGRMFIGFNFGIHCVLMTIYVAEISSQNVRGMFGSTHMFSFNIGVLLQFILGASFSLRLTNAITFGMCIIQFILLLFLKESPYFLVASGQHDKAKEYLMWFRASNSDELTEEFSSITKRVETRQNLVVSFKNLFSKNNYKGFVLCMVISFLADLTGRVAVLTYVSDSFIKVADVSTAKFMTILLGICNILFPIIPMLCSDKIGRKIILITGSLAAVWMHLWSGCVFLWFRSSAERKWLLFGSMAGYLCCISLCVTIILTLRGEIISENSRGLASGFSSMAIAVGVAVSTKAFQIVSDQFGWHYAFWLLAGFSMLLVAYTWILIPETKNRSFAEIQSILYSRKVKKYTEKDEVETAT